MCEQETTINISENEIWKWASCSCQETNKFHTCWCTLMVKMEKHIEKNSLYSVSQCWAPKQKHKTEDQQLGYSGKLCSHYKIWSIVRSLLYRFMKQLFYTTVPTVQDYINPIILLQCIVTMLHIHSYKSGWIRSLPILILTLPTAFPIEPSVHRRV